MLKPFLYVSVESSIWGWLQSVGGCNHWSTQNWFSRIGPELNWLDWLSYPEWQLPNWSRANWSIQIMPSLIWARICPIGLLVLCRSTKAFLRRCSSSNCNILAIRCSSNSHSATRRIFSNSFSLNRSQTYILKLGIWNYIGITASQLNATENGVI